MATRSSRPAYTSSVLRRAIGPVLAGATFSLFATMILTVFLSPFGYMTVTALKDRVSVSEVKIKQARIRRRAGDYSDLEILEC